MTIRLILQFLGLIWGSLSTREISLDQIAIFNKSFNINSGIVESQNSAFSISGSSHLKRI